jgi:hypothetical protein
LYISVFASSIQQEDGFSRAAATASASVVSQVLLPKASPCCFAFPLFSSSVNLATREEAKGFRGLGSATMGWGDPSSQEAFITRCYFIMVNIL